MNAILKRIQRALHIADDLAQHERDVDVERRLELALRIPNHRERATALRALRDEIHGVDYDG